MRKLFLLVFNLLLISSLQAQQQKLEVAFTIPEKDLIPEGIAYDAVDNNFYVGSIQKRKIVRISHKGAVADFIKPGQDNVLQVLGMKVDSRQRLWVCNNSPERDTLNFISNIHVYDLKTGQLVKKFQLSDGKKHLFNDVYITNIGDAFVTDSEGGAIYVIRNNSDSIEEFVKSGSLVYPNGITATEGEAKLIVSTSSVQNGLVFIDLNTRSVGSIKTSKNLIAGIDGLYRYKNSLVGIQNVLFPQAIHKYIFDAKEGLINEMVLLAANDEKFDIPTTGAIVGDYFYCIANSQLSQILGNNGAIKEPEKLQDIIIAKIRID